jgi:hypothetical protein
MTSQRTRYGATVAHVITLMDCGRTQMARRLLETLAVDDAAEMRRVADEAYRAGFLEGQQALAAEITGTAKPKRPRAPRRHEWLRARISDPQLRERTNSAAVHERDHVRRRSGWATTCSTASPRAGCSSARTSGASCGGSWADEWRG